MGYVRDNLQVLAGTGLAIYFLWSMILDPAQGPLPGTVLPLAIGLAGFGAAVVLAARGLRRVYAADDAGGP